MKTHIFFTHGRWYYKTPCQIKYRLDPDAFLDNGPFWSVREICELFSVVKAMRGKVKSHGNNIPIINLRKVP